ncbi:hypothetical protein CH298_02555 [Rhodococcoides fascians]|uniref:hypothetical protein n=1 Tax=Rhodococcoides fascians TaxID=1828 RepID=UPI000B9B4BAE|nr:hypothetical protein [Rhodococcus fascians]OZE92434.1 hypothetical protein CH303_02555 [Rhodococcus fascians]OZF23067.1 hypothetical protein CH298_02555 [Rhodococcus fascians]OZF24781.1 hypothetical protein CH297_02555 [Rhodococcus fascians]OZF72376.1 hypothetical protein CH308_02560 [Rhodococcus fascians]OZF73674.1 hypothetical protein CH307_02555 [Rhodococcus fascians]
MNDHQIITNLLGTATHSENPDTGWALATEALALATAASLPLLVEEAEAIRDRIDHDTNCKWCRGKLDLGTPPESFWCTN